MGTTYIVLIIVGFFLLPAVPAVLFYIISPKTVRDEARTVAAYGPVSVKVGGAAALYLAFFFLLNHTPLMDELKTLVSQSGKPTVSLKGNIIFVPPSNINEDDSKELINDAYNSLSHASVNYEPTTQIIQKGLYYKDKNGIGSYEITIPRSWVVQLQKDTHPKLQVDPQKTASFSSIPIEIDKGDLPDQSTAEGVIQISDIRFQIVPVKKKIVEEQIHKNKGEPGDLYKRLDEDKSNDPYATLEVKPMSNIGR